jgi:hypothetical protein
MNPFMCVLFAIIYPCDIQLVIEIFRQGIQWRTWQISELPFRDV